MHLVRSSAHFLGMFFLLVAALNSVEPKAVSSAQTLPLTIPVQIASNLVYVQGRVNDSRQMSVILDTGASLSIVAPTVAKEIGLHASGSAEAAGFGHGSSESLQIVENAHLKWGNEGSDLQLSVSGSPFCLSVMSLNRLADRPMLYSEATCLRILK